MTDDVPTTTDRGPAHLMRPATFPPGRLGTLALMSAASGAVPLPFIPTRMLSQVRGAVIHDVVRRHGLCLTGDARRVLAEPGSTDPRRAHLRSLGTFLASRLLSRFGPAAFLTPALAAIETFALGHLFDRYLEDVRKSGTVRVQVAEATLVRTAIDRALLQAISPEVRVSAEDRADGAPEDDLRDDVTRIVDGVLLSVASLPAWIVRRLDAAFDKVVEETPELHAP